MDKFIGFCLQFKKYIIAGCVGILMVVLLAVGIFSTGGKKTTADKGDGSETDISGEITQVSEDSDIYQLISAYYDAYAEGDIETLSSYAEPISDYEASYIKFLSKYLDAYEIVGVYSQQAVSEEGWFVSVNEKMKFTELDNTAPGLDFFYVQQKADGTYFINNVYSTFNMNNKENDLDPQITALIAQYEQQDQVVELRTQTQAEFNEIALADKDFNEYMTETMPEASAKWVKKYKKKQEEAEEEAKKAEEEAKKAEEEEAKKAEEEAKKAEEEAKKAEEEAEEADDSEENSEEAKDDKQYVYTTSKVNIRKKPSVESAVVVTVKKNKKVEKLSDEGDWIKVKYKGKKGYIRSMYVTDKDPKAIVKGNTITIKETINIRKTKSTDSPKVAVVNKGDKVYILKPGKTWTKVKYKGRKGYIKTSLLK